MFIQLGKNGEPVLYISGRQRLHQVGFAEVELPLRQVHWNPKPVAPAEQVGDCVMFGS